MSFLFASSFSPSLYKEERREDYKERHTCMAMKMKSASSDTSARWLAR